MDKYLNKKYGIIALVIIISVITGYYYFITGEKVKKYDTTTAKKGDVVQEVNVTGKVRPVDSVELAFESGGKISSIFVDVGDNVSVGQILTRLDSSDMYALYLEAQANEKAKGAELAELKKGAKAEELAVYETKLNNAKLVAIDAEKDLVDNISDAFTKSDDAIRSKGDQLFSNPTAKFPLFKYSSVDSQLKIDIEKGRSVMGNILTEWGTYLPVYEDKDDASKTEKNLNSIKEFLDKVSLAVNILFPTYSLTQATIDGYKADIYMARNNINIAIANLTASESKLTVAKSAVTLAEQELILKQSGATKEQLAAGEARFKSSGAKVRNYSAQLTKRVLRSPIKGIVTKQDAKVGEMVTANTNIVSIISESAFEIKANVPEADIANLVVGDTAVLTLDAYGDREVFSAKVESINPAETVIEGVSTYEVILLFTDVSGLVKSGMTANVNILTNKKENVVFVPVRAINLRDGKNFVKILNTDGIEEEREVEIGLRGSYGNMEIKKGVKEGEKVIIFEVK